MYIVPKTKPMNATKYPDVRIWTLAALLLVGACGGSHYGADVPPPEKPDPIATSVNCVTSSPSSPCISGVSGNVTITQGTGDEVVTSVGDAFVLPGTFCGRGITLEGQIAPPREGVTEWGELHTLSLPCGFYALRLRVKSQP